MTADYIICRLDNGYVVSDESGELCFKRLHDALTYIKNEEAQQDYADVVIDASIVEEENSGSRQENA